MLTLFAMAFAAQPSNVNVDDVFAWEDKAWDFIASPKGCWQVQGTVSQVVALFQPPSLFSTGERNHIANSGTFSGRLRDGVWDAFDTQLQDENDDALAFNLEVFPLFGLTHAAGDGLAPANMVRHLLERDLGATATSGAKWDNERDGVALDMRVPIKDQSKAPESQVSVFFPQAGPGTEMDVVFPKSFKEGPPLLKVRISNAQLHLRGRVVDQISVPVVESMSGILGVIGYTVGYEQKLVYTDFRPCTADAVVVPVGVVLPQSSED